jgi:hypothetical protein
MGGAISGAGNAIGSAAGKVGNFITGNGDEVQGTGQTVGDLKDIGYSNGDIASMGGGQMTAAQKFAKGLTGVAGAGMRGMQQPQQRPGGYAQPIQVTPTPDVSGYYQQKPLNPADPYSAFYGR